MKMKDTLRSYEVFAIAVVGAMFLTIAPLA
jgi:hypothetical protein